MAMTLGESLTYARQLEVDGVISKTALALIRLMQEYRNVVGVEVYEQIITERAWPVLSRKPAQYAALSRHEGSDQGHV